MFGTTMKACAHKFATVYRDFQNKFIVSVKKVLAYKSGFIIKVCALVFCHVMQDFAQLITIYRVYVSKATQYVAPWNAAVPGGLCPEPRHFLCMSFD